MRFGIGKDIVTPDVKTAMGGYGTLYGETFTGIHDDLYVKTLVLEDDKTRVALVTVDSLMDDFAVTEALADFAQAQHGIPREHVFLSYTHTHAGPAQRGYDPWQATEYYEDFQLARMQSSLSRACVNMVEGTAAYGVVTGEWNISRRKPTPEGVDFVPNFEYPRDRDLGLLRLRDLAGQDRALLLNYSCHPVTMGATRWLSAEYPGRLCQLLEARYYGLAALFFQGAGGCTRPLITADSGTFRNCTFSEVDGMARSMSAAVEEALQVGTPQPVTLDLAGCWFTIPLPTEKYPREHYEAIASDLTQPEQYGRNQARAVLETYDTREPVVDLHAGIARLGQDLYVAFMCGETCYEAKQATLEAFPGKQVIFIGYGDATAYIPGDRMVSEGGYEADRSSLEFRLQGKFQPGLNERFRAAYAEGLERL
jgi:neutral ceramidase